MKARRSELRRSREATVRAACVDAASGLPRDVLLPALRAFSRGGLDAEVSCVAPGGPGWSAALGEWALALTRRNMRGLYDEAARSDGAWRWRDADKRAELEHADSRFLVVRERRPAARAGERAAGAGEVEAVGGAGPAGPGSNAGAADASGPRAAPSITGASAATARAAAASAAAAAGEGSLSGPPQVSACEEATGSEAPLPVLCAGSGNGGSLTESHLPPPRASTAVDPLAATALAASAGATGRPLAFLNFRFVSDGAFDVLYVYELQLEPDAQRRARSACRP